MFNIAVPVNKVADLKGLVVDIQRSLFSRVSRQQIPIARRSFLTSSSNQGK